VAWLGRWDKKPNEPAVHWKKGLKNAKDVKEFIRDNKLSFPLAVHFRTASVGGKHPQLCHPFPVSPSAETWLEGHAEQVLFHNGSVFNWDDLVLQVGLRSTERIPNGRFWSDTRGLAWLVYMKGEGILPFVLKESRVALFDAKPASWGQEGYSPKDHFDLWGTWIHKDGFSQSISTDSYNRGGTVYSSRRAMSGYRQDWEMEDEEVVDCSSVQCGLPQAPEPPKPPEPTKEESSDRERAWKLLRGGVDDPTSVEDVWPLDQLRAILAAMKREQANAKIAAGV